MPQQTYATHRRYDPSYHIVAFGLLVLATLLSVRFVWKAPGSLQAWWGLLLCVLLLLLFFKIRIYALRVQDRLIRLEERLRLGALLEGDLKARVPDLREDQFVGLRFAPDAELPDLVRAALAEGLDGEAIKKRIKVWRPDTFRV